MTWRAFVLLAAVLLVSGLLPAGGSAETASDFADWTSVTGSPATASGTLHGSAISLSGTNVLSGSGTSVTDATSTVFNRSDFTPALATSDAIGFRGDSGNSYTLTFASPVTDPIIHFASLAATLHFPSGTAITRLSGDAEFSVSGSDVIGQVEAPTDDANGTVRLTGTFSSLAFTTEFAGTDGVYLQVGATVPSPPPPPPPPPPSGGGGGTAPPPPFITAMHRVPVASKSGVSRTLLEAQHQGVLSQLQWFVNGSSKPALVSAPGQDTLRFRPPPGGITIGVRGVGPGGAGPTVNFQVPGTPSASSGNARRIDGVVTRRPGVIAAGGVDSLISAEARAICTFVHPVRVSAENGLLDIQGGCLRPLTQLSQMPSNVRGIVVDAAKQYGIPLDTSSVNLGLDRSDAYVSTGQVRINGVDISPGPNSAVVVFPQIRRIAAADATVSIGPIKLGVPRSFEIDTTPRGGAIPFGSFPSIPGKDIVRGFGVFGDVSISAVPGLGGGPPAAAITADFKLPSWLSVAGVEAHATVDMRATTDGGLVLNSMRSRVKDIDIGPVAVKRFQINYTREPAGGLPGDRWEGQGVACLPTGTCLDMAPPNGGVRIVDGELDRVGASLDFSPPIPLFPGIDMNRIGFAFGLDPTRFLANTELLGLRLLKVDGRLVVAFPSAADPYRLSRDTDYLDPPPNGPRFPRQFYDVPRTTFTAAISGGASLSVPVIGDIPLGAAYFLYEYPGYMAFGGGIDKFLRVGKVKFAEFSGAVQGEINASNRRFDIHGDLQACLGDCPDGTFALRTGGDVHFSTLGASVCVRPPIIPDFGVAIYWPDHVTFQGPGCKWSPFHDLHVRGARDGTAAAATLPHTFTVRRGDPGVSIKLDGMGGGAPLVRVTGPGGQALASPAHDGAVGSERLMIIRFDEPGVTTIGMRGATPGTYRIEALPGSPATSGIATSTALAPARVRASVAGAGTKRVLRYSIGAREGQRVNFLEVTSGGGAHSIGTVTGGSGNLHFSPAPGLGRRTIVAQFELSGLPAERINVARFTPPSPRLGRVAGLRVRRRGAGLQVSWRHVSGASGYELVVTTSGTEQRKLRLRGTATSVHAVPRSVSGRVNVRAIALLRQGPTTGAAFRATARRVNRLRVLPRSPRLR
jgi:hypothetical protein